jgi:hypothetical protein
MPLKGASELAEPLELLHRDHPQAGKGRIDNRTNMPVGKDEAIPLRIVGVPGVQEQVAMIKNRINIRKPERSSHMSALGGGDHPHHITANLIGKPLEVALLLASERRGKIR